MQRNVLLVMEVIFKVRCAVILIVTEISSISQLLLQFVKCVNKSFHYLDYNNKLSNIFKV